MQKIEKLYSEFNILNKMYNLINNKSSAADIIFDAVVPRCF